MSFTTLLMNNDKAAFAENFNMPGDGWTTDLELLCNGIQIQRLD
jgi:hypothetical protein